jgi:hypothetical protein
VVERGPQDEITRAEGHRYLARLIGESLKTSVEPADRSRPLIAAKLFSRGDTSDARYFDSMIDGRRTYRLRGQRGTTPLIGFTVYDGKMDLRGRSFGPVYRSGREDRRGGPLTSTGSWLDSGGFGTGNRSEFDALRRQLELYREG